MKRLVFLVAWLLALADIPAQAKAMNNEAILDTLLVKAVDSLALERYVDSSGVQIVVSILNPEKQAFCRGVLMRYFSRKKIPVFQKQMKARIVVEVFEPKIVYKEPTAEILGFGGHVTRQVRLRLQGWLEPVSGDRGIIPFEVRVAYQDYPKRNRVSALEAGPFSFTRGQWVSYSRWTRFLQPTIVLGSVSLLMYLFFSLRS